MFQQDLTAINTTHTISNTQIRATGTIIMYCNGIIEKNDLVL